MTCGFSSWLLNVLSDSILLQVIKQAAGAYTIASAAPGTGGRSQQTGIPFSVSPFLLSTILICVKFTSYFAIILQPGEVNVQFHHHEAHRQQK
jgi:hypothetical protein